MERELGDEFEVDGVALRVVEASNPFSCDGCYFLGSGVWISKLLEMRKGRWKKCSVSDCIITDEENG